MCACVNLGVNVCVCFRVCERETVRESVCRCSYIQMHINESHVGVNVCMIVRVCLLCMRCVAKAALLSE